MTKQNGHIPSRDNEEPGVLAILALLVGGSVKQKGKIDLYSILNMV